MAGRVAAGTRVLALSNLFAVAVGDERVSAQHGVVSTVVPLEARRGAFEAPYRGEVYLLDYTTSNPGSAGGAQGTGKPGASPALTARAPRP